MAKFCTKCGNPLEEGVICACQQTQSNFNQQAQPDFDQQQAQQNFNQQAYQERMRQQQQFNEVKEKSISTVKDVISHASLIIKSPVTAGQAFIATGNMKTASGLIVLQAIISAIFSIVVLGKANSTISAAYSFFSSGNGMSFSLIKAFFITGISSTLLSFILAGILLGLVKAFRGETTFAKQVCLVSTKCVIVIPVILASLIIFFLNITYGFAFFFLGSLLGIYVITVNMSAAATINKDMIPYLTFITSILMLVVFYFVAKTTVPLYLPAQLVKQWNSFASELFDFSNFSDLFY